MTDTVSMSPPPSPKTPSPEGLTKSAGLVSGMTLLSRILGVVRDMVIANFFGASAGADSFFLAFKIPNFFRRLFGEGAFSQAFVPVLSQYRTEKSHGEVRGLVAAIGGSLGINLLILTVLGVIGAPLVIGLFAAGFVYGGETEKLNLATEMLRLTFPYVFLICMTAFAGSVLNSYGRFGPPAFTPVLLNVCLGRIVCRCTSTIVPVSISGKGGVVSSAEGPVFPSRSETGDDLDAARPTGGFGWSD